MSDPKGSWAGGLLVNEAWRAYEEGRYQQAQSAARRAVDAAMELDDVTLLVRGLRVEADSLTHLGDYRAAWLSTPGSWAWPRTRQPATS